MRRAELLAALEAAHVPAGPINTVAEAFADPQVIAREMRLDLPATGARGGMAPSVRSPMVIDGEPAVAATAAPRLGEHTDEVLGEYRLRRGRDCGAAGTRRGWLRRRALTAHGLEPRTCQAASYIPRVSARATKSAAITSQS